MKAFAAAGALLFVFAAHVALGQEYPSKPVEVVTPYGAGGTVDIVARQLTQKFSERFKKQFVVIYKLGASGTIAATAVARANPDGHTLMLAYTNELAISPSLMQTSYTVQDFEPIAFIGSTPFVLIGRKDLSADNLKQLVQLGLSQKGLTYGSAGNGSLPHIAGELLRHEGKTNLQHVPYKGGPQAISDLLGGHVDLYFSGIPGAIDLIRSGRVKAYAVTDAKRSATLPQVPTVKEQLGIEDFGLAGWFVLLAPKGTPKAIVQQLREASIAALREPDVQEVFRLNAVATHDMSPPELAKFMSDESQRYGRYLKDLSISK